MKGRNVKKLRVGVIGAGYLGRFHAQKYKELENAELAGVVDIDRTRAEEVASLTNATPYTDYQELFDKVDAVSIVTPTETHLSIGLSFLSRGIDVLVEKPIARTPDEASLLIKEAAKSGAVLQVGHLERFNPAIMALSGRVKNPMFIESHRLSPFTGRALDVDVVLDLMIHDIDIILNLTNSEVEAVDAVGIPVVSDKADIANARLKFKNGCVANVTASRISKERLRRIRIFQSDAYMVVDYTLQEISVSKLEHVKDQPRPEIIEEKIRMERKDTLKEEIKSFLECCASRSTPYVTGSDGKRALEIAQRIQNGVKASIEAMRGHLSGNPAIRDASA